MPNRKNQLVELRVYGRPAPQGSKVRTPYGMRESSKFLPAWRDAVRVAAVLWMRDRQVTEPLDQALELEVTFWIERPRTITVEQRPKPSVTPDLDKLVRTMDSLTVAGLIRDDARIVSVRATKEYADDEPTGARIRLFSA